MSNNDYAPEAELAVSQRVEVFQQVTIPSGVNRSTGRTGYTHLVRQVAPAER